MRISDWSSDVCSSDLSQPVADALDTPFDGFDADRHDSRFRAERGDGGGHGSGRKRRLVNRGGDAGDGLRAGFHRLTDTAGRMHEVGDGRTDRDEVGRTHDWTPVTK